MAPGQATIDQKKRKRMESNRESARRSRLRKQQHLEELIALIVKLRHENNQYAAHINAVAEQYRRVVMENFTLQCQLAELTQRLNGANAVLRILEESEELAAKQWQFPQATMAPIWEVFPC